MQQPTVHLHMSDVTPVRHAQGTLSILRVFLACAAALQTANGACPLLGTKPLKRRSASDICSVRCEPTTQEKKIPATFDQILPSMKYIFAFFFQKFTANLAYGTIFEKYFSKNVVFANILLFTSFSASRCAIYRSIPRSLQRRVSTNPRSQSCRFLHFLIYRQAHF